MAQLPENTVEAIARQLTTQIMRGELPPHARLPPVRTLADQFEVNTSTIHRVLASLQARGWVQAEVRRGVVVLDPRRHGGTGHWPQMLENVGYNMEAGLAMLRDALDTRAVLAVHVVRAAAKKDPASYAAEIDRRMGTFSAAVDEGTCDPAGLLLLEHEITRVLLTVANKPATLAIFNDVERMVLSSPPLLAAMYDDPSRNVAAWHFIIDFLRGHHRGERGDTELEALATMMSSLDENTLETFAAWAADKSPAEHITRHGDPQLE